MSGRRRSLTVNSHSPVPRVGNGWTTDAEHNVFIQLSVYGQIEKVHKKASRRIQTKINHLNTTLFIFGLLIGSFGVIDTYFGDSTPVWMKVIQLIIGYAVSVITQIQTKNKSIAQMEVLKEIAGKCAYKAEHIKNVLHMPQSARPPADIYILSINADIQCLFLNTPIPEEMPKVPELREQAAEWRSDEWRGNDTLEVIHEHFHEKNNNMPPIISINGQVESEV